MASPAIPFVPLTSHRAVLGSPPPWPPPPQHDSAAAAAAARLLQEGAGVRGSRARSPAGLELEPMVLDLNAESPTAGSASATSSSSGVAGGGGGFFRFDLLGGSPDEEGCSPSPPVVTRQLFPSPHEAVASPASDGSPPPEVPGPWTRRAADLGAQAAQAAVQGPSSPAAGKKSRRGPRSRSSQYRGVTFYRRTGRWESHIW